MHTTLWIVFSIVVLVLLALDLGVLHRTQREIGLRESILLSAWYIAIGSAFGVLIAYQMGISSGIDYFTAFLIEKSLSMDNIFVMAMIFSALKIPKEHQHRILFWGILGVVVLRGILIATGIALFTFVPWIIYLLGLLLVVSGVRMMMHKEDTSDAEPPIVAWVQKYVKLSPPWIALISIECADLIFALDSVPAVFAITQDPLIAFTSNVFAILGLRALYFALAAVLHRFVYVQHALSAILIFVGLKMLCHGIVPIPTWLSLVVTMGLLTAGIVCSLRKTQH